jgi:protein-disulfide isomerase
MEEIEEKELTKKEKRELAKLKKRQMRERGEKAAGLKKFAVTFVVVALIVFLGYRFVNFLNAPSSIILEEPLTVTDDDNVKGNPEAGVTLFKYSDFQCPACATYQPMVQSLGEEFPDDLKIVYRHLPLVSIHPNSVPAAKASEAAGMQEKFWEMHDILFERQQEWSGDRNVKNRFVAYAEELGLDVERFNSDFDSREIQEKITGQMLSANRLGINSTPTFFIGDTRITPRSFDDFRTLIEEALAN